MRKKDFENLNSGCRKTLEKMDSNPSGVRYREVETLLLALGFVKSNKGKTSGSRVGFYYPGTPETNEVVMLHKPHPKDEMNAVAVKKLRDRLRYFYENAT